MNVLTYSSMSDFLVCVYEEEKMSKEQMKDFSLLDPIVSSDPFDFYNILHHEAPVYKIPETGTYVITKYQDLKSMTILMMLR